LLLDAVPAAAMSCRPLEDRYVLACGEAGCEPRFRARDVPSRRFGLCERRVVLESVPRWAMAPIEEVLRTRGERPRGVVEVVVEYRPLLVGLSEDEAWLRRALQTRWTRLTIRAAIEGETALRAALERRSVDELWAARKAWAVDVISVSVVTFALLWSYVWFVRRIVGLGRRAQLRLLAGVLAGDGLVLLLGASAAAISRVPVGLVAALLSVLVALVEIATCAVTVYRAPTALSGAR